MSVPHTSKSRESTGTGIRWQHPQHPCPQWRSKAQQMIPTEQSQHLHRGQWLRTSLHRTMRRHTLGCWHTHHQLQRPALQLWHHMRKTVTGCTLPWMRLVRVADVAVVAVDTQKTTTHQVKRTSRQVCSYHPCFAVQHQATLRCCTVRLLPLEQRQWHPPNRLALQQRQGHSFSHQRRAGKMTPIPREQPVVWWWWCRCRCRWWCHQQRPKQRWKLFSSPMCVRGAHRCTSPTRALMPAQATAMRGHQGARMARGPQRGPSVVGFLPSAPGCKTGQEGACPCRRVL